MQSQMPQSRRVQRNDINMLGSETQFAGTAIEKRGSIFTILGQKQYFLVFGTGIAHKVLGPISG